MNSENGAADPEPSTQAKTHRARRIISMVLVVFAAIVVPIAVTAVWATRTILNSDRFTETTLDVTSNSQVIDVVAARVTDEVATAVSGAAVLDQLPPAFKPVIPIVVGAVRTRVQDRVKELLASDAGQSLIEATVRQAHAAAMRLLNGDGLLSSDAFTVQNGTVTLDLRTVIHEVLVGLQQDGVIPSSVTIPPPGEASAALATRLGVTLPPDFGQVVVFQTQNATHQNILDAAQRALAIGKRGVVLLVVLGLVLVAAAIAVAVDRRRATFRVGLAVVLATLVLIVVARRVAAAVPDAASTPGAKAVAAALAGSLRSSLVRALIVLVALSAVVAAIARWWSFLVANAAAHADVARFVAIGVGIVLLLVLGLGWGSLIFAAAVTALLIAGIVYASRQPTEVNSA